MNRRNFIGAALAAGGAGPTLPKDLLAAKPLPTEAAREQALQVASTLHMCVFDTFGTVVDWRSSVIAEVELLSQRKGWNFDAAEFADAWRANYGPSRNQVRTGELPWTDLDALHRMTLDGLLDRYGIERDLTEEEKVHLNKVWHRLHPWPDAPEGLARLKTRYVLSPLSNGNVALLTEMAKFGGLPWDCVLGSDVARHYKPDKEMYLMPSAFFDIPTSAVLMVAAHPGDLDSAKSYGLRTAFVFRPHERGPDAAPPTWPEVGRFDFMATDFKDLARQLGIWSLPT